MIIDRELFLIDLSNIILNSLYDFVKYNKRFGSTNQCYGIGQKEFENMVDVIIKKIEKKYDLSSVKEN